jgi:hypothetical protein
MLMQPLILALALVFFPAQNQQQTKPDPKMAALTEAREGMPSKEEIAEVLAKADEKVSSFEAAIKAAKPRLDQLNPDYAKNDLEGAATAHELIAKTLKNGASAYALVGILITLDDLSPIEYRPMRRNLSSHPEETKTPCGLSGVSSPAQAKFRQKRGPLSRGCVGQPYPMCPGAYANK